MQRLIYHGWLNRESLPRDNRSHAPDEVRSKCLDLSSVCIAVSKWAIAPKTIHSDNVNLEKLLPKSKFCICCYRLKIS
jgi:hypothetical protein